MSIERSWCEAATGRTLPNFSDRKPAMSKLATRTAAVGVASAAALVMAGGVAYAFWTANGTGVGAAQATTVTAVNGAVGTVTTVGLLYPGSPTVTAQLHIHNTNASVPVKVTAITVASGAPTAVTGAVNNATCLAGSGVSITAVNQTGLGNVIVGGGDFTVSAGTVSMSASSPDACQGGTFTWPVTVTAQVG